MISMVISPLIRCISIVTLLITPLITTHEPPSTLNPKPETLFQKALLKQGVLCSSTGFAEPASDSDGAFLR